MKKKILFVITKSNWGGAQRYVYDLATSLAKKDFEVKVALGGRGPLKDKLDVVGVEVITIPHLVRNVNVFNELKVFFDLVKIFNREKPDVVHLNSSKVGGLGSLAGRLARVPKIIFTAHGWAFNEDRSIISKLIIRILAWMTMVLSHNMIAVSKAIKKQVENWLFVSGKIKVVYNAVQDIGFRNRIESREILLGDEKKEGIWVGTIAELHKNKGLKYAIEAMALILKDPLEQDLNLIIIGEGDERKDLEKLIKEKKLENNIFLVGARDEAVTLLKALDVFILPSITEALGYTLLEAGQAGLPAIGSTVGGIPEIIEDGVTGILVRPRDPKDLAKAIRFTVDNKEEVKILATALHKKVKKDFALEKMIGETIKVYEN